MKRLSNNMSTKRRFNNVTIGSDPEIFLVDEQGKLKSAIGLIGGTKESPRPISNIGHAVQEDNVLGEFNIPASKTAKEFSDNIQFCLDWFKQALHPLQPKIMASGVFDDVELDNPTARMAGCNPDFNAWLLNENKAPSLGKTNLRSAGGHVSVGYENPNWGTSIELIKLMDLFLGIPSVILDRDNKRRELYGKAGCYRLKEFGFEYRTLSAFWIATDELRQWVFNNTIAALAYNGKNKVIQSTDYEKIQDTINKGDVKTAIKLVKKYNIPLPASVTELELEFELLPESNTTSVS